MYFEMIGESNNYHKNINDTKSISKISNDLYTESYFMMLEVY